MSKMIFNLLAAAIIAVSFAPVAFAGPSDEELIQRYDELFDKWVGDGLSSSAIFDKSEDWIDEHHIKSKTVQEHIDQKCEEFDDK